MSAANQPPQEWFEMMDLRRRRFASAVWVPLRAMETVFRQGEHARPGFAEELFLAGSVAFSPEKRAEAEKLDWHSIGLHEAGPYAYRNHPYKPVEVYQRNDREDLGVDLVFVQQVGKVRVWHLSQDLALALRLLQEGDIWVRPEEGYVAVVRQRRDAEGDIIAMEVRAEFLRDYLAARGMALRLYSYRSRRAIMEDASHIKWPDARLNEDEAHNRFMAGVYEVGEDGGPYGAAVAVMHAWRTDVHLEDDVPVFGPESNDDMPLNFHPAAIRASANVQ